MRVLTVLLLASVSFAPVSLMAQAGGRLRQYVEIHRTCESALDAHGPAHREAHVYGHEGDLGDPDPALFDLAAAFKVTDIRQTAAPEPN